MVQEVLAGDEVQALSDEALRGDPLLTSWIEEKLAGYVSSAHCHLNQVFQHVLGKLVLGVPEIEDREGRASAEVLRHVD